MSINGNGSQGKNTPFFKYYDVNVTVDLEKNDGIFAVCSIPLDIVCKKQEKLVI